nr:ATP-binding protein [Amylibacter sp.]
MIPKRISFWLQWIVLAVSLAISYFLFNLVNGMVKTQSQEDFTVLLRQGLTSLSRTSEVYEQTLGSLSGLFIASDHISADEMADFAAAIDVRDSTAGIDAIGFASVDTGATSPQNIIVERIEPAIGHEAVLGLDLSAFPAVQTAAQIARETHEIRLIPNVTLPSANGEKTLAIMLKPVFRPDHSLVAAEPTFMGYAFTLVDLSQAFATLSEAQSKLIELRAWVGTTDLTTPPIFQSPSAESPNPETALERVQSVTKFGQPITLSWRSTPFFDYSQPFRAPWFLLTLCLMVTLLLFTVMRIVIRRERTISVLVEQKSNELETRETERRSIIENAMLSILSVDAQGIILQSNDAAQNLLLPGNFAGLTGRKINNLLPNLDLGKTDGRFKLTMPSTKVRDEDTIIEVEKNTWLTSDNEIRITLLLRDITASEEYAQEITKTEQRWNLALMGAQIGVFDIDLKGQTSVVSEMWRKMMKITDQADNADPYHALLDRIHPEDRDLLVDAEYACAQGISERAEARFRVKHAGDDWRWIQSDAIVVERSANGTALRMLGTQMDITESIELDRMKRDFIATVSHELRTPLTSIKGSLSLLEAQMKDSKLASVERLIQIAQSNSDRLFNLVNDILDMEKMNAGRMSIELKAESLSHIMVQISDQIGPYAAQWRVGLDVSIPKGSYTLWTDQKRVIQVLANLLSNACKFADEGTRVNLTATLSPTEVRIAVTNTGAGIPEEFHNRIFQPFSQADTPDTKKKVGTGLGLNISRQLVEAMGGEIGFESEPGKETVFWFTCPLANAAGIGPVEKAELGQLRAAS